MSALCGFCTTPLPSGTRKSKWCRDVCRKQAKKRDGKCWECNRPVHPGNMRCLVHLEADRLKKRSVRAQADLEV